MLDTPRDTLLERSRSLAARLRASCPEGVQIDVVEESSRVGGGALPLTELPGHAVALRPDKVSVDNLSARLRAGEPAVMARIQDDQMILNPRTVAEDEEEALIAALSMALRQN